MLSILPLVLLTFSVCNNILDSVVFHVSSVAVSAAPAVADAVVVVAAGIFPRDS